MAEIRVSLDEHVPLEQEPVSKKIAELILRGFMLGQLDNIAESIRLGWLDKLKEHAAAKEAQRAGAEKANAKKASAKELALAEAMRIAGKNPTLSNEDLAIKMVEATKLTTTIRTATDWVREWRRKEYPLGVPLQELRMLPKVMERVAAVREHRANDGGPLGKALAEVPTQYHVTVVPDGPFLAVPEVSSERRQYVPVGWLDSPAIPSNKLLVVRSATLSLFGLMTSAMHMAWLSQIGGRMKSDFSYSPGLVYNPFPWPQLKPADTARLDALAQSILDARASHEGATLADLYDPDVMPPDLRRAHRNLDLAVDQLYRKAAFESDRERVEHLFALYEKTTAGLFASADGRRRKRVI